MKESESTNKYLNYSICNSALFLTANQKSAVRLLVKTIASFVLMRFAI